MALTLHNICGFETGGLEEALATVGAPSVQEAVVRTGDFSLKLAGAAVAARVDFRAKASGTSAQGNMIVAFAFRTNDVTPTADVDFLIAWETSFPDESFRLRLKTNGDVKVVDDSDTEVGTITSPFTVDTFHFIEIFWQDTGNDLMTINIDGQEKLALTSQSFYPYSRSWADGCEYRFQGGTTEGEDIYIDDIYYYHAANPASPEFLGDCEVFRYQADTASATPDVGDDLDTNTWQSIGETPIGVAVVAYTGTPKSGDIYTDDTQVGKHYRHGPHGDGNIDGTVKGAKWIHVLRRGTGGGTTHYKRYGNDADTISEAVVELTTDYASYFTVSESATEVPLVTEHFAFGMRVDGAKNLYCREIWAMLLHVPSAGVTHEAAAALSGEGTLSVSAVVTRSGAASLAGEGTLAVAGTIGEVHEGAASLSAEGSLVIGATAELVGAALLEASSTLGAAAVATVVGASSVAGEGVVSALGRAIRGASIALAGAGALAVAAVVTLVASTSPAGAGTLTVAAQCYVPGAASIAGEGTLSVGAVRTRTASTDVSGGGALGVQAVVTRAGVASLSGEGSLTVVGNIGELHEGAASIAGGGTLTASAVVTYGGAASLAGQGTLQVAGVCTFVGACPLVNESDAAISAGANDGEVWPDDHWTATTWYMRLGSDRYGWWRWPGVPIPQGSPVQEAKIQFRAYDLDSEDCDLRIEGCDEDDSVALTSWPDYAGRDKTALVEWNGVEAWTGYQLYWSANFRAIVETITAREGWNPGQAIQIIVKGLVPVAEAQRQPGSYDGGAAYAAILHLEWLTGGAVGILTVAAQIEVGSAASSSGEGTLAVAAVLTQAGVASLSSEGALTVAGGRILPGAASLTAEGTLTAAARKYRSGAATLSGEGTLGTAGVCTLVGTASLAGEGTLGAASVGILAGAAALAGEGTTTASASPILVGAATLAGEGTLQAIVVALILGEASPQGQGSLTVTAVIVRGGVVSLSGSGTLTVAAFRTVIGIISPSGEGTLAASAVVYCHATVSLVGGGTLTVAALCYVQGVVSLSGAGALGVAASPILVGVIDLSGEGTLTTFPAGIRVGAASLNGEGTITVLGWVIAAAVVPVAYATAPPGVHAMASGVGGEAAASAEVDATPAAHASTDVLPGGSASTPAPKQGFARVPPL